MPQALPDGDKDKARRILIKKFQTGVIDNRVHFRNLPKIARAEEVDKGARLKALRSVFADNKYSLKSAYDDSVAEMYAERDVLTRVSSLIERLQVLEPDELDEDLKQQLRALEQRIHSLLEDADALQKNFPTICARSPIGLQIFLGRTAAFRTSNQKSRSTPTFSIGLRSRV